MLKRNNRTHQPGRPIHTNVLMMDQGCLRMSEELHERFITVLGRWKLVYGEELITPVSLNTDLFLWRTMVERHRRGDFRNTDDEYRAMKRIAEWVQEKNCCVTGQPHIPIPWGD